MKKIILLLLLSTFSFTTFAQSKKDLIRRAGHGKDLQDYKEELKIDSDIKAFITYRLATLKAVIGIEDKHDEKLIEMFAKQYTALQEPYNRYIESKSDASKVDLMKIIVKNEEELRSFLSPEQKLAYLRYGDKIAVAIEFDDNFMSDYVLEKYKKNLK